MTNQNQRWERLRELNGRTKLTRLQTSEYYVLIKQEIPALLEAAAELSALEVANAMNIKMAEEVTENLEQQLAAVTEERDALAKRLAIMTPFADEAATKLLEVIQERDQLAEKVHSLTGIEEEYAKLIFSPQEEELATAQNRVRELERFAEYVLESCGREAQGDPIVDAARDALKGEFKD